MANQNGRNVSTPDENRPSWRPQDETGQRARRDEDERYMSRDRDDDRFSQGSQYWEDRRDRDESFRSSERYGQGQSGYGAGRYEEDRSFQSRNMGYPSHMDERARERGLDERFSQGRGGSSWGEGDQRGGRMGSGYGHGEYQGREYQGREYQGRGGYLGQGGQQMGYGREGQWGNEGYSGQQGPGMREGMGQGSSYGMQGNYGSSGNWSEHQQGRGGQQGFGGQQGRGGQQGFGGQQTHRGKGPSGYTRSDERIREMVCEALTDDHHIDASNIEITVKSGEVILSGTVEDRQQKRLAEDVVEQVSGVKDVQNQIRVATDKRAAKESSSSKETETTQSSSTSDKRHRA